MVTAPNGLSAVRDIGKALIPAFEPASQTDIQPILPITICEVTL